MLYKFCPTLDPYVKGFVLVTTLYAFFFRWSSREVIMRCQFAFLSTADAALAKLCMAHVRVNLLVMDAAKWRWVVKNRKTVVHAQPTRPPSVGTGLPRCFL